MEPVERIVTAPVRLTGTVHPQQISSLLAIDVLIRRMAQSGENSVVWELSTIAGDVATQHAVRRAVVREGDNREELGREGFAARADRLHAQAHDDLKHLLSVLQLQGDLERWSSRSDESARAARIAFVRLFEEGLLTRTDAVLDSCPSCETVVDDADVDVLETEVEQFRLSLSLDSDNDADTLEIDLDEPELIIGAVAVAVPEVDAPAQSEIYLPVLGHEVPIVPVAGISAPALVVPGHYQWCYEIARQLDLPIEEVIDAEGVVHHGDAQHPGSLDGLSRYAARAAATELLAAEGYITEHFTTTQTTRRCHRCGSTLVALRGRHWILSFQSLVAPVVETIQAGAIASSPPAALDRLLEAAQQSTFWCVSQQLWSGQPIPVYSCLDCGQTTVTVDKPDSCPSCMGTLEQDTDVLDARFIAAVTPLAMLGWPQAFDADSAQATTLSVGRSGLDTWALPMAALGVRLAGMAPFSQILVHQFAIGAPEPGHHRNSEFADLVEKLGTRTARAGLLLGELNVERAQETVASLESPGNGAIEIEEIVEPYDKALESLDAGGALSIVLGASREGLSDSARSAFDELVRPLLTD